MDGAIKIGLLGLGTVGGGVATILPTKSEEHFERLGRRLEIAGALVRSVEKHRDIALNSSAWTTNADTILDDPTIDIIVEVIGGEQPAKSYIERALKNGKHVVTANKEVMAKHGPTLLELAREHQVALMFEASVGGGIPIIAAFQHDLAANNITGIRAIINGTTNYILTKMAQEGSEFADALAEAQALGYAEADPVSDVDGYDAAYKLSILASIGFGAHVHPDSVNREGIRGVTARDFRYARELGYAIKLLAIAGFTGEGVDARVHPALIPIDRILAKVDGVFNAVEVDGDLVGRVLFYGQGAGAMPTSSAIVADVLALAASISRNERPATYPAPTRRIPVVPTSAIRGRYYLRLVVSDRPGVLAQIATVLGETEISIAAVQQTETHADAETAELVIMTHASNEAAMQRALAGLKNVETVQTVGSFIRVLG